MSIPDRSRGTHPSPSDHHAAPSIDAGAVAASLLREERRDRTAAEAIQAQVPVRVAAAAALTAVQAAIIAMLPGQGSRTALLWAMGGYLLLVVLVRFVARTRGRTSSALVTMMLAGDIAFVFVGTAVSTSPAHYERALFGAMVVIHVANFYFGRRQAWRVLGLCSVGYLAMIWTASHLALPIDRVEEVWTLLLGVVGTVLVIAQAGHVRRRLRTIVTLFERAEQGDFSQTYDEASDQRYDAITRVGTAYNRVRVQLASMVLSDPLTGCANRRGFEQALAREISRARRAGTELALLVLDLDHFKLVNDTYGHPGGDEVLRATGRLLLEAARIGDIVARVGGEEFAVLLPATSADGALHFASRLCEVVRTHRFALALEGGTIRVTTSIGVAAVAPRNARESGNEATVLTRRSDMALYAAKRSGRDRARAWTSDLETLPRPSGPQVLDEVHPLGLA
jgi:diguanylate cyclase (GGDEF)-like protein